jgi:radical SAM superfamily enzyme YgiQ (UPF0313 family)
MNKIMKSPTKPLALLINPPIYDFALYDLFLRPYGMLRIGAWLESGGWEVRYVNGLDYTDPVSSTVLGAPKRKVDGTGKFHRREVPLPAVLSGIGRSYARYGILSEELVGRLAEGKRPPDAVFLATGMTYWYPGPAEAAKLIGDLHPRVPLIAGGIYASLLPEHCRSTCGPDYIVRGDDMAGLTAFLEGRRLPVPAGKPGARTLRHGVDKDYGILRLNHGCPRDCDYCASRLLCGGFHPGDPSDALEEFEGYFREGVRSFAFYDDALLSGKEEVLKPFLTGVLDFLAPAGAGVSFYLPNAVHIDLLDEETARLMVRAGFREIRFGFESSSASFHTAHDDQFEFDDFHRAVDACRAAGFPPEAVRGYVLCGLPGQTREEVERSVEYCAELGVRIHLARYSPVPGTRLWPESVRLSRYPIDEEPLLQNNTFFSLEWEGFTRADLSRLSERVTVINRHLSRYSRGIGEG